ncbi:MAG: hypothetical protein QM612_02265 [Thermomonas sp.]|uniref:hypothetical protein n=1 Tax=Thermomonas sp. TaxID=1971895 RepID=UPI0039E218E0
MGDVICREYGELIDGWQRTDAELRYLLSVVEPSDVQREQMAFLRAEREEWVAAMRRCPKFVQPGRIS